MIEKLLYSDFITVIVSPALFWVSENKFLHNKKKLYRTNQKNITNRKMISFTFTVQFRPRQVQIRCCRRGWFSAWGTSINVDDDQCCHYSVVHQSPPQHNDKNVNGSEEISKFYASFRYKFFGWGSKLCVMRINFHFQWAFVCFAITIDVVAKVVT